ncbi:MAG: DUF3078 domain-containing protein [Chitinophagaceae bacterium]|nr:DUF3078 domain-containing protein [Chitinophagaceae bacterium]MBK8953839.1 DUF3078 domain-containing protein [Chitinophagaceae bacterium]
MKRLSLFFFFLFSYVSSFSQDAIIRKLQQESLRQVKKSVPDTGRQAWKAGLVFALNIGQGSQSNWAAGGDDFSFTANTATNIFAFYKKDKHSWDNTLDINFGYINTTSLGSRKNDDRFDLLSKYGYKLNSKLNLSTLGNFRSQFLKGYTYPGSVKTFASEFMAPAYLIASQGLDYKPTKSLSIFLSPLTSRWVFVNDSVLSAKGEYGVEKGKKSTSQTGAFATIGYQQSFNKILSYKTRIDLFSNYKLEPKNVDLFMTNTLTAKVAKIIAFSWNVDLIYDDDVTLFGENNNSPGLQFKSVIGVGLQVRI